MNSPESNRYKHLDEVEGALRAAERIIPLVLELTGPVKSVADVGGGTGAWLRQFRDAGIPHVRLFDSAAVEPHLLIPRECFQPIDLECELPPAERFDLVVSVECAEHLRSERAEPLVQWLTSAADIVLFSAAIPGQGGKEHRHEEFPNYWAELFGRFHFVRRDVIRHRILFDASIPWWYRQNLFLYVKKGRQLAQAMNDFLPEDFTLIHRQVENSYRHPSLRFLLRQFPPACIASIRAHLRKKQPRQA